MSEKVRSMGIAGMLLFVHIALGQTSAEQPNLNGVWQAFGTAHWDLEGHNASKTSATRTLGALGAIPAGMSVIEGGTIPYQDWAIERRKENRENWQMNDVGVKCFIPGIPRSTYMPLPFQILQADNKIFIAYEWGSNLSLIHI